MVNNAHAQNVQNGVIVDSVRGDLCQSSRKEVFRANFNICFGFKSNKKCSGGLGMVLGRSKVP